MKTCKKKVASPPKMYLFSIAFLYASLIYFNNEMQARSQTFFCGGGESNWSNFGTFYDYTWIILQSCWIWPFWGGQMTPLATGLKCIVLQCSFNCNIYLHIYSGVWTSRRNMNVTWCITVEENLRSSQTSLLHLSHSMPEPMMTSQRQ